MTVKSFHMRSVKKEETRGGRGEGGFADVQGLEEDDDMLSIELVVGRSLYCMHASCCFGRKAVGLGALSTQESAYLGVKGRTRKERKPKVKPTNGFPGVWREGWRGDTAVSQFRFTGLCMVGREVEMGTMNCVFFPRMRFFLGDCAAGFYNRAALRHKVVAHKKQEGVCVRQGVGQSRKA